MVESLLDAIMKSDLIMFNSFSKQILVWYCCLAILDGLIFLSSSLIASDDMIFESTHT